MIKNINRFKVICNCIIILLFFVSCASKTNTTETAKSDNTEIVEISSELTTEEVTTEDPDLLPVEVVYEPIEYDEFPEDVNRFYLDKCYGYVSDLIWPEYIEDTGEDDNGLYAILRENKNIEELNEINFFIGEYDEKIMRFKPEYDWAWFRSFLYGMEDPVYIDLIVNYYNASNNNKIDRNKITVDSINYFNFDKDVQIRDGINDGAHEIFHFSDDTLYDIASYDQKLTRAIMVSLGRKYFIQEIPFSYFDKKLSIEDGMMKKYNEEIETIIKNLYTNDDILNCYYNSIREFEIGYENGHYIKEIKTYKELYDEGLYYDCALFEYITEGNYSIRKPICHQDFYKVGIFNHNEYLPKFKETMYGDTVEIRHYLQNDNEKQKSNISNLWEEGIRNYPLGLDGGEYGSYTYEFIDIPEISEIIRKELPINYKGFHDCCTYNNQFYITAFQPTIPNLVFRDDSNGAISMELSDDEQKIVIEAYEKAGTPLQTDGEGHIAVETPAHYKEVYGVDYRDVLKEAGLE